MGRKQAHAKYNAESQLKAESKCRTWVWHPCATGVRCVQLDQVAFCAYSSLQKNSTLSRLYIDERANAWNIFYHYLEYLRNASVDNPDADEVNSVGTIATVAQHLKLPTGNVKLLVEGICRARLLEIDRAADGYFEVVVKNIERDADVTAETKKLMTRVSTLFERYIKHSPGLNLIIIGNSPVGY